MHFNSEMLIMSVSRRVATQLAGVTPASFLQLRSKQGEYNEDNRFKEKKLISLIVAVIMTVSGMYVENISIDSSFACEDTANQNFTQAAHLSRPSESCTEKNFWELGRPAGLQRDTADCRRKTAIWKEQHYRWQQYCLKIRQKTAGTLNYGNQRMFWTGGVSL